MFKVCVMLNITLLSVFVHLKKKFTSLLALHVYLHVMLHKAGSCKGYLNKPTADI